MKMAFVCLGYLSILSYVLGCSTGAKQKPKSPEQTKHPQKPEDDPKGGKTNGDDPKGGKTDEDDPKGGKTDGDDPKGSNSEANGDTPPPFPPREYKLTPPPKPPLPSRDMKDMALFCKEFKEDFKNSKHNSSKWFLKEVQTHLTKHNGNVSCDFETQTEKDPNGICHELFKRYNSAKSCYTKTVVPYKGLRQQNRWDGTEIKADATGK